MARKTVIAVIEVPDGWLDDPDAGTRVGVQVWIPALAENKEAEILFAIVADGGKAAEEHGFDPAAFEDEEPSVEIGDRISVKDLAERLGVKTVDVLMHLVKAGTPAIHVNSVIDKGVAEEIASAFGRKASK